MQGTGGEGPGGDAPGVTAEGQREAGEPADDVPGGGGLRNAPPMTATITAKPPALRRAPRRPGVPAGPPGWRRWLRSPGLAGLVPVKQEPGTAHAGKTGTAAGNWRLRT